MYVHKEVFAGVYAAIQRLEAPIKKAWTDAMSEKGRILFGPLPVERAASNTLFTICCVRGSRCSETRVMRVLLRA